MFGLSQLGGLTGSASGTPGGGGPAPAAADDPFWENVVFLSRMDADPPVDLSISAHTVTDGGAGATLDTTNQRFGDGCRAYDDSATGYDEVADSTDFDFGTGDFTIECWLRLDALAPSGSLVTKWDATGNERSWILLYNETGDLFEFYISTNGTDEPLIVSASVTPAIDTWYHVVVSRSNGITRLWSNGGLIDIAADTNDYNASTAAVRIGGRVSTSGTELGGQIDEVRITKGIDRYG